MARITTGPQKEVGVEKQKSPAVNLLKAHQLQAWSPTDKKPKNIHLRSGGPFALSVYTIYSIGTLGTSSYVPPK
ncbi:hypothetical protein PHISCL_01171 [Aspergillus sclerotialis]|uniref:Uncharacterized protein n=1 Tax=Aspergillus sclerotialis TaxID=2070753 RepID=A0A3A3AAS2_9EURO|nr:hypothetical protein PHISCL_01171 [Aspergillus sclerotialis]